MSNRHLRRRTQAGLRSDGFSPMGAKIAAEAMHGATMDETMAVDAIAATGGADAITVASSAFSKTLADQVEAVTKDMARTEVVLFVKNRLRASMRLESLEPLVKLAVRAEAMAVADQEVKGFSEEIRKMVRAFLSERLEAEVRAVVDEAVRDAVATVKGKL